MKLSHAWYECDILYKITAVDDEGCFEMPEPEIFGMEGAWMGISGKF